MDQRPDQEAQWSGGFRKFTRERLRASASLPGFEASSCKGDPYPRSGVVRSHASDKKEFYKQCNREPVPDDSAILFVGVPQRPEGTVFSPSLIRVADLVFPRARCENLPVVCSFMKQKGGISREMEK